MPIKDGFRLDSFLVLMIAGGVFLTTSGAVGSAEATEKKMPVRVEFTATPLPASPAAAPYTESTLRLTFADGETQSFPLQYQVLYRSGDDIGGARAGEIRDRGGRSILDLSSRDPSGATLQKGPYFANAPDGSSLIRIPEARIPGVARPLFHLSHFENLTLAGARDPSASAKKIDGLLPMAVEMTLLDQDAATGNLNPVRLQHVDTASAEGLWHPCTAGLTPWNTHLGVEEFEPDAAWYADHPLRTMNLFLGRPAELSTASGGANPYHYGHAFEIRLGEDGTPSLRKLHNLGRFSHEIAKVMPDGRTVYLTDDNRGGLFALFIADRAGDLSSGTLYAARWEQNVRPVNSARLVWIRLGHAADAEVASLIGGGIRFADIFDRAQENPPAEKREPDFVPIFAYPGWREGGDAPAGESLRLKPGMEGAAAFLETRRYAALRGATTEFTKIEGLALNAAGKKLYSAVSYADGRMLAEGNTAPGVRDDIRLAGDKRDLRCGLIYASELDGNVRDSEGHPIPGNWVAVNMTPMITGAAMDDACDPERVANPDNLEYSPALRTLFIGEDSKYHVNNFLWAHALDSGVTTRILVAPQAAEITGVHWAEHGGHAYLLANMLPEPNPGKPGPYHGKNLEGIARVTDPRGVAGYIAGLPSLPGSR